MKYKVGDRVIGITKKADGINIMNLKGTIISVQRDENICVEFDKNINGHSCSGKGKENHCWWVNGLEHVKKCSAIASKIVITSDGTETLARLYEDGKVVKSATAKCSPEDEFKFDIGAKLAFDRLVETTEEKKEDSYFNGKAVCVKAGRGFTVGKIYNFVDGKTKDNFGDSRPVGYRAERSLKNWEERSAGIFKFIPIVEDTKGE